MPQLPCCACETPLKSFLDGETGRCQTWEDGCIYLFPEMCLEPLRFTALKDGEEWMQKASRIGSELQLGGFGVTTADIYMYVSSRLQRSPHAHRR